MQAFDLIICGAGPVGCTVANRAAHLLGWKVLIIDKRKHLAGNCFDEEQKGVLVHRYGPHYFRTNSEALVNFLSLYTEWIPGNYIVKSFVRGELFPFPINLLTLGQFFNRSFTPEEAKLFLSEIAEDISDPQNSEEIVLSKVGRELYEAFFRGYTVKQWGKEPKELLASVCGRIPLRLNTDCRYVDHKYQITPKDGFTNLFRNMIAHPNISVQLGDDYQEVRKYITPRRATLYTGPVDEYFQHRLGKLPWRSLHFDFVEYKEKLRQPCVQINYPNDFDYTRTVEIKHVTQQQTENTVISYEYPRAEGDPFYPIPSPESQRLFQSYKELAEKEESERSVYFAGRLAQYCYINTDEAIEIGLRTFGKIKKEKEGGI